ncbi:MAG: hypothetical protein LBK06_09850 [Planctomycetaceae bacterium]|jgi:hypothetical protein|nr:hypothetical protein [Planctomycetaceae bacterium]
MPQRKRYVPRIDSEFIAWVKSLFMTCSERATEWQLDPALLNQFAVLCDDACTKFDKNADKETKNHRTTLAKDAAFSRLKSFLSGYVNLLEGNENITDEEIDGMGLRPRHPGGHLPIPVPDEAPDLSVVVGQHHDVTIYVSTLQHGHPTHYLKDGKYAGFICQYKIEGEDAWHTVISTKLHHTFIFTEAEEGKHITIRVAWLNPTMQQGPWSEEVTELIN